MGQIVNKNEKRKQFQTVVNVPLVFASFLSSAPDERFRSCAVVRRGCGARWCVLMHSAVPRAVHFRSWSYHLAVRGRNLPRAASAAPGAGVSRPRANVSNLETPREWSNLKSRHRTFPTERARRLQRREPRRRAGGAPGRPGRPSRPPTPRPRAGGQKAPTAGEALPKERGEGGKKPSGDRRIKRNETHNQEIAL